MRVQSILISLILSLSPMALLAGGNHDHGHGHSHDPINQQQAEQLAIKSVARLINKGKIDDSWKSVSVANAEKKKFGAKMEWVVSFKNDKISDTSKQTLYVFLSLTGKYIGANYTGK